MVFSGGAEGGMCRVRRDMVNEQVVHILLECILVWDVQVQFTVK